MSGARRIVLSADDYGISEGVSRGILDLIGAGRLSATAAMTNWPEWLALAPALLARRERVAIGLHLNLTAGSPLEAMPVLAPTGIFPGISPFLHGKVGVAASEIAAEIGRQLDSFEEATGMAPDFVDGHHHVHIFPPVRRALIAALVARYPDRKPLVRNPGDHLARILVRRAFAVKAAGVAFHARGLAADLARAGLPTNDGFSGFSAFDRATPYGSELDIARRAAGPRHLAMCHPGHVDATLQARDDLTDRREDELATLLDRRDINAWLWPCRRDAAGRVLWWQ
ncbi:hypothetical protein SAMN02745157_2076 [Kaistia soli DSM 19436]|uniref:Hopanoid biosynthesis associated protein HpnK n=1 Tax=Kaistia soli DSM 19436 TaxID=1122133 RepID=A0A1M5ABP9_9HYPH|nr:ChbG/HpnK family deacetylase [Kaistia soli]SHF27564.1 hypothetical protein SAMN02745157_2076 [Kaistia soli DSM 19436]